MSSPLSANASRPPEDNNKKVTERCSRNAPELNLFFVLRRNYYYDERRSIILRIAVQKSERRGEIHLGLTTCYLAAEGVVEAQTGAGRVPEQISSSSAATLNRDHFRKETATIYRVTRRTWRHKRIAHGTPKSFGRILFGVAKTFSIKVTGHELLLHAWKSWKSADFQPGKSGRKKSTFYSKKLEKVVVEKVYLRTIIEKRREPHLITRTCLQRNYIS